MTAPATHVYEIFIKASQQRVWEAITDGRITRRYFHHTAMDSDLFEGATFRYLFDDGSAAIDGVVEEVDPPHRLVLRWHVLYDEELAAEPPGRVEWALTPASDDETVTRVTVRHGDLHLSPGTWKSVRLGWVVVLDGMKTLLESGSELGDVVTGDPATDAEATASWHREMAVEANAAAWELLAGPDLEGDTAQDLLERAYAAAYHWRRAGGRTAANDARAAWLIGRANLVTGRTAEAMRQARRCARLTGDGTGDGLVDFDVAYPREGMARALAASGRHAEAIVELAAARAVVIADDEDRAIFAADLAAGPWFDLAAAVASDPTTR